MFSHTDWRLRAEPLNPIQLDHPGYTDPAAVPSAAKCFSGVDSCRSNCG